MIEFFIGFIGVLMAAWGAVVSVRPPKEPQFKIISLTAFGVGSLILVVLLWIHTNETAKEKQDAAQAQQETRATLVQSQKEFREFRGEIVNAQKETAKPGSADEKLDRINERLNKALGKPLNSSSALTTVSPPAQSFPPSANPFHFNGEVALKGSLARQLLVLLRDNNYKGPALLYQLEICGPDTSSQDFYVGQSDVSAKNGFRYPPGECNTLWNIDATQLYFFAPSDGRVKLSVTSR